VSWVTRLVDGVWEFVVGDDWRLALGAAVAIAATAALAAAGVEAWWLTPLAVAAVLSRSVMGAAGRLPDPPSSPQRQSHADAAAQHEDRSGT
jgi:hypothetical protein